jgi:mannose-6-phosphate isomerase-like protein (cupin superfamily)
MMNKVNLESKLRTVDTFFCPKIVARMNDYKIAIVKTKGEFVWHKHDDTDDFFLVLKGRLCIQLRGSNDVVLEPGELFVVPKGVEHCPRADEETHVLLIEPTGTQNTGDAGGELTAQEEAI